MELGDRSGPLSDPDPCGVACMIRASSGYSSPATTLIHLFCQPQLQVQARMRHPTGAGSVPCLDISRTKHESPPELLES